MELLKKVCIFCIYKRVDKICNGCVNTVSFKKHSALTAEAFKAWRKSHALTQSEAGKALGLKTRMIQNYEKGTHKIPRVTALACWALAQGKVDFDGEKAKKLKDPVALTLAGDDEKLRAKKTKKLKLS